MKIIVINKRTRRYKSIEDWKICCLNFVLINILLNTGILGLYKVSDGGLYSPWSPTLYRGHYLLLLGVHTWGRPLFVEQKLFSSENTTRDQKSWSLWTCWSANSNRLSFMAGILWWIPAWWRRFLQVSTDTCSCSRSRIVSAVLNGVSLAACRIRWSCWGVVTLGRGLLSVLIKRINQNMSTINRFLVIADFIVFF